MWHAGKLSGKVQALSRTNVTSPRVIAPNEQCRVSVAREQNRQRDMFYKQTLLITLQHAFRIVPSLMGTGTSQSCRVDY